MMQKIGDRLLEYGLYVAIVGMILGFIVGVVIGQQYEGTMVAMITFGIGFLMMLSSMYFWDKA